MSIFLDMCINKMLNNCVPLVITTLSKDSWPIH